MSAACMSCLAGDRVWGESLQWEAPASKLQEEECIKFPHHGVMKQFLTQRAYVCGAAPTTPTRVNKQQTVATPLDASDNIAC